MLLFKAEVDIQYRLHKVASCLPADSAEIQTSNGYLLNSNYATKHTHTNKWLNNLPPPPPPFSPQ